MQPRHGGWYVRGSLEDVQQRRRPRAFPLVHPPEMGGMPEDFPQTLLVLYSDFIHCTRTTLLILCTRTTSYFTHTLRILNRYANPQMGQGMPVSFM